MSYLDVANKQIYNETAAANIDEKLITKKLNGLRKKHDKFYKSLEKVNKDYRKSMYDFAYLIYNKLRDEIQSYFSNTSVKIKIEMPTKKDIINEEDYLKVTILSDEADDILKLFKEYKEDRMISVNIDFYKKVLNFYVSSIERVMFR